MNIAYLISAHTDAAQLKRLIDALQQGDNTEFFVHIDKKCQLSLFASVVPYKNVHFIEERVDVRWGTMLQVEYQINLLREAVRHSRHFERIFLLSGLDYPLWSNQRINEWLEQQGEREILQGIDMSSAYINAQQRELYSVSRPLFRMFGNDWNQRLSIICRRILKILGYRKKLQFNVGYETWNLYKGSSWWCISEDLARYVLDVYGEKKELRRYFSDSFGQDETLIQTIAFNSPQWAKRCILTKGAYPGLAALTPLHFIDYNPEIKVMDETDEERLLANDKMFFRKAMSGKSDELIKRLKR